MKLAYFISCVLALINLVSAILIAEKKPLSKSKVKQTNRKKKNNEKIKPKKVPVASESDNSKPQKNRKNKSKSKNMKNIGDPIAPTINANFTDLILFNQKRQPTFYEEEEKKNMIKLKGSSKRILNMQTQFPLVRKINHK